MKIQKILKRLLQLHPKSEPSTLNRIKRLLKDLNSPENKISNLIQVVGTNSKHSCCVALREIIEKGGRKLSGTHDFSTFRASNCYAKSPKKTLKTIRIRTLNEKIIIQFESKSFLRNQVRSMVGCLKYLGEKKWNLKKFESVFKSKKRKLCAPPAPSEGLYLEKVIY